MSFVSIDQFRELIQRTIDPEYIPRRGRNQKDHQSGELFTGGGDTINKIKVKFYLEDDGDTWDTTSLIKPQCIFDMKKISASFLVSEGLIGQNIKLKIYNALENYEGIKFLGLETSKILLVGTVDLTSLNNYTVFSMWFEPNIVEEAGQLFTISDSVNQLFRVAIAPANVRETFVLNYSFNDGTDTHTVPISSNSTSFNYDRKYHLIVSMQNGIHKVYLNGEKVLDTSLSNIVFGATNIISIGNTYKGTISYITLQGGGSEIQESVIKKYFKLGYPLPRNKEYVDLSSEIEKYGTNLLIEAKDIERVLESFKGQFYVKTNNIKVRS